MGSYAIKARFEAGCAPEAVLRLLDSTEGIASWWSNKVEGRADRVGETFRVSFPTTPVVFELEVKAVSDEVVEWHVPDSPPWWKGTTIRFELGEGGDRKTNLLFTHSGFDPQDPIIEVITPAWVRFLDNLIAVAVSGMAAPAVVN